MIALRSLIGPGIVLAASASLVYGGWSAGVASTERSQLELDKVASDMAQVMREAVAVEVGKIKLESKTYVRNFKEIEKINPVFVDCQLPEDAKRLLDTALEGRNKHLSDKLPD